MARINGLLPYSVVLVNDSPHRLLATAVTWVWKDAELGTTYPHQTMAIDDFNDFPDTTVQPGQGRLFTPNQSLNVYFIRQKTAHVPADGPHVISANAFKEISTASGRPNFGRRKSARRV
jgi:hypothetical protein